MVKCSLSTSTGAFVTLNLVTTERKKNAANNYSRVTTITHKPVRDEKSLDISGGFNFSCCKIGFRGRISHNNHSLLFQTPTILKVVLCLFSAAAAAAAGALLGKMQNIIYEDVFFQFCEKSRSRFVSSMSSYILVHALDLFLRISVIHSGTKPQIGDSRVTI